MTRWIGAIALAAFGAGAALPAIAQDVGGSTPRLPLAHWVGNWAASEEQSIAISLSGKKTLAIEGFATYGALDPERVERGAVNMGEFWVSLPSSWINNDNAFEFAIDSDGEAVPSDQAGEYDCVVSMQLDASGRAMDVSDNRMCGGMNVSFTGRYVPAGQ